MAISSVRGCRRPHPPQAVPLPLQGEGLNAAPRGDHPISGQALIFSDAASEALPRSRRGEALRRAGWVGGVHPSAPITARTAASGGQRTFTRAARSARLRFAVRSLSEANDREIIAISGAKQQNTAANGSIRGSVGFECYFANSYIAMAQITQWVMKSSTVQFS